MTTVAQERDLKEQFRALKTTPYRLDAKANRIGWTRLTDAEKAASVAYEQHRASRGEATGLGEGVVLRIGGRPVAWFEFDTWMHGGRRYPLWQG